jgi:hypothetical protein
MEVICRYVEDTMLYFICGKCRTEFKADKRECSEERNEGQRDEVIVSYLLKCPDCGTYCTGMSRRRYIELVNCRNALQAK